MNRQESAIDTMTAQLLPAIFTRLGTTTDKEQQTAEPGEDRVRGVAKRRFRV